MSLCPQDHPKDRPQSSTVGLLCSWHADLGRWWLTDVEDWWRDHRVFAASGSAPRGERGDRTRGRVRPSPVRELAVAVSDRRNGPVLRSGDVPDVPDVLVGWASFVVDGIGGERPTGLSQAFRVLTRGYAWLCAQQEISSFLAELRDCQTALAKVVGEPSGPIPLGPCLYCQSSLYDPVELERWSARRERRPVQELAELVVECRNCGKEWTGVEILRLRLALKKTG